MSEFVTVKKSDPQFSKYILGSFSKQKRAIPVKYFLADKKLESVTFEVQDVKPKGPLTILKTLINLIRWPLLTLTLSPTLFVALMLRDSHPRDTYEYLLAFGALMLFHSSLFAWNDFRDHINGWDIIRNTAGTRTIQQGLLSAYQVRAFAWACLTLSLVLAMPLILSKWAILVFALAAFSLAGLTTLVKGFPKLKILVDQVALFYCFGPLLIFGTKYFLTDELILKNLPLFAFVAFFMGFSACLYIQSRQFSNLMNDDRSDNKTLAVFLGFDRMKNFLVFEVFVLAGSLLAFLYLFEMNYLIWLTVTPLFFWFVRLILLTRNCGSPVSSKLSRLPEYYLSSHWLICFWLILEALVQ